MAADWPPIVVAMVKVSCLTGLFGVIFGYAMLAWMLACWCTCVVSRYADKLGLFKIIPIWTKMVAVLGIVFSVVFIVKGRLGIIRARLVVDFHGQWSKRRNHRGCRASFITLYEKIEAVIKGTTVYHWWCYKWVRICHFCTKAQRPIQKLKRKLVFWKKHEVESEESRALLSHLAGTSAGRHTAKKTATRILDRVALEFGGQEQLLNELVERIDESKDGILSRDELQAGFKVEFGIELSVAELDALVALFDEDGDGEVTFAEFKKAVVMRSDRLRGTAVFEDCMQLITSEMDHKRMTSLELLHAIDADGSGDVDPEEFRLGFKAVLGINMSDENIDVLFKEFDEDGSGTIDSAEFISKMATLRGEPDVQASMKTIVEWMETRHYTVQQLMAMFDEGGGDSDGILTQVVVVVVVVVVMMMMMMMMMMMPPPPPPLTTMATTMMMPMMMMMTMMMMIMMMTMMMVLV